MTVEPYERQDGESDERWEAFQLYRDQLIDGEPRRHIGRVAKRLSKSRQLMTRWAGEDNWASRVAAFDREQDAIRRSVQEKELREIVRRQGTSLGAAAQALMQPIEAYLKRIVDMRRANPDADPYAHYDLRELAREARDAARLIPQLVQVERLVHGLSTQNIGGHEGGPIDIRVEEARRRARGMTRGELEQALLGAARPDDIVVSDD